MCSSIFFSDSGRICWNQTAPQHDLRVDTSCCQSSCEVPHQLLTCTISGRVAMDPPKHWKLMDQCPAKNEISRCLQGEVGCADLPMEGTEGTWNISKALDKIKNSQCKFQWNILLLGTRVDCSLLKSSTNNFSFCHANLIPQSTNPQIPIKIKSYPKKAFTSGCVKLINIFMTLSPLEDINSNCPTFSSYPPTAPTASSKAL